MNILILANHFNPGGISSYILNLSRGLSAKGHKVYLGSSGGAWVERLRGYDVEHIYLPLRTKSILSPKLFLAYRILRKFVKEKQIELIHAQTRVSSYLAFWVSQKASLPYLTTAHGFFRPRLERLLFPFWGNMVIAISEPVRQHLVRDFRQSQEKIKVVHNGIDTSPDKMPAVESPGEIRKKLGLKEGPVVGIIARLSEVKGHKYLLTAMQKVIKEIPNAQLLSIGGGRLKKNLINLACKLGIEERVSFIEAFPDSRVALSVMDVFVMPSLQEGLGLALMEAMLLGVVAVASNVGGIPSLVRHNQTGVLVSPADHNGLALAIIDLLKNKNKAKILASRGKDLIIQDFSLTEMVKNTEQVYRDCLFGAAKAGSRYSAKRMPWRFFAPRVVLGICAVLILSFGLWLGVVISSYTPPILMYHYIDKAESEKSKLGVSPEVFERQMSYLCSHKYNIVSLEALINLIKAKKRLPPRTVAITFDDGYLNNYTYAFPVLKKYNIPATFFIIINRVGKRLGQDDYMNWQQIKEMSESSVASIGSHSVTHPNLSEVISDHELRYEIFESKSLLEKALNKKVNIFSYPFGGNNNKARAFVVAAGYKGAVGTNFPTGHPSDDIYALKRLRISENCKNMFVFWIETSGFYTYIKEHRDTY